MPSKSIYSPQLSKYCTKCNTFKSLTDFSKDKRNKDGYTSKCKICDKEYYNNNKDKKKEYYNINKTSINEYSTKYQQENKEHIKEYNKKYYIEYRQENTGKINANTAKRRTSKLYATPKWAEFDLIEQLYVECRLITKSTGIIHHVDHKVPIQSEFVCGLHCIANLQILTAIENHSKSNSYWPDMF